MMNKNHALAYIIAFILIANGKFNALSQEGKRLRVKEATSQDEFLSYKVENSVVAALLFDGDTLSPDELTKYKGQLESAIEGASDLVPSLSTIMADTSVIPSLAGIYNFHPPLKAQFMLFIKNQLVEFPDLTSKVDESNDSFLLTRAIVSRINQVVRTVVDAEEIVAIAKAREVVVYLGSNQHNRDIFEQLAMSNIDFAFYVCTRNDIKSKLYKQWDLDLNPYLTTDQVVFVRSLLNINEMDPHTLVYSHKKFAKKSLEIFFEFGKYPKVRKNKLQSENIQKLYQKKQVMLLLVLDPGDASSNFIEQEFKEAVKTLPRRLIYAITDIYDTGSGPYHGLASHADAFLTPNSAYIAYVSDLKPTLVQIPHGKLSRKGISDYMMKFYNSHKWLFPGWSKILNREESSKNISAKFIDEEL